jgi:hypothetical protein
MRTDTLGASAAITYARCGIVAESKKKSTRPGIRAASA